MIDGQPTAVCPEVPSRYYVRCSTCGRLYDTGAERCRTPDCSGKLIYPFLDWGCFGGNAQRTWSVALDGAPPIVTPSVVGNPDTPAGQFRLGATIYTGGSIFALHGANLRRYRPDGAAVPVDLRMGVLPSDGWRLAGLRGKLFACGADAMAVVDASSLDESEKFDGVYVDALVDGRYWIGLRHEGAMHLVEWREGSGGPKAVAEFPIQGACYPSFPRRAMVVIDADVFVGFEDGSIYRAAFDGTVSIFRSASGREGALHALTAAGSQLIVLETLGGAGRLTVFDTVTSGDPRTIALDLVSPVPHPTVLDGRVFVGDANSGRVLSASLGSGRVSETLVQGSAKIRSVCGASFGGQPFLFVQDADASERMGAVKIVDPQRGTRTVCHVFASSFVTIIPADGNLIVASADSAGGNGIRVFRL